MKRVVADNGVVYYCSELIPCPHGFSTRIGGVSILPHTASLNLGVDRGDSDEIVLENLKLYSEALGIDSATVISAKQIHSDIIRRVDSRDGGEGYFFPSVTSCDGYMADEEGVTLGIRTADCVPILMYARLDEKREIISAVHAGWRGTLKGIAPKAIRLMTEQGVETANIKIAIGPSVRQCCYEVDESFYGQFKATIGTVADDYIVPSSKRGHYMADIVGINRYLLVKEGILPHNIDHADLCTCCTPNEFFSHRLSGDNRGTMLALISLRGVKNDSLR